MRGPGNGDKNNNSSSNGVGGGGVGVGGRQDFSSPANGVSRTDSFASNNAGADADLQEGGATLIRLTVPRVAIRVCSPSSVVLPGGRGAGLGPRTREGGSAPTVTVTAKWLEGHLEMEDPGARVVPPVPTPSQSPSPSDIPVRLSPTTSTLGNADATVDGGAGGSPPFDEAPTVTAEGVSSSGQARDGAVGSSEVRNDASRPPPLLLGVPRGETHRLRWLAVRKLSFRMAEPPPFPATSAPDDSRGAGTSGGVASVDQRASVRRTSPGGNRRDHGSGTPVGRPPGVEAAGVEEDGVSVEGLWAEWSPALFFLAGKSGAMVRYGVQTVELVKTSLVVSEGGGGGWASTALPA